MNSRYIRKGPSVRVDEPFGVERVDERGIKRLYYYSKKSVRRVFENFVRDTWDGEIRVEKNRHLINGFFDKIYQYHKTKDKKLLSFVSENISSMLKTKKYTKWLENAMILVVYSNDFYLTIAESIKKSLNMKSCVHLVTLSKDELLSVSYDKRIDYINQKIEEAFKNNIDKLMKCKKWVVLSDVYSASVVQVWVDQMKKRFIDVETMYLFSSN